MSSSVFTRVFDLTYSNGVTTQALIVSNGKLDAKCLPIVNYDGVTWRFRKQLTDKNSGRLLSEYMYVQDSSLKEVKEPSTFFQDVAA